MWEWLTHNSLWVLIVSALFVIFLLFFGERIRKSISNLVKKDNREKANRRIGIVFWIMECLFVVIMIGSLVLMLVVQENGEALITAESMKQWILEHGLTVLITFVVGIALWAALKRFLPAVITRFMARPIPGESIEGSKRRANTIIGVTLGLAKVVIILVTFLMVLSELDVSVGPILAGFGVVGIAVGFGAQYLIRDLIAGVFILLENQYRVGDVARVADVSGLVEEINLRKTVLRDIDGIVHHVPNGEIRVASNMSRHYARVNLNVSVAYNTDLDFAIDVINRICREMAEEEKWKKIFRSVPAVLRVDKLGDSGIEIKITGDVKPLEQWNAMGELRLRLKRTFDKEGIEIPYPHMKVYFGDKPGAENVC